jgi:hypothetical protein
VARASDAGSDFGIDGQLFVQFAGQGLLGTFSGLDLAPGELPFEGHGLIGTALADEDFISAQNEPRCDEAHRFNAVLCRGFFHSI